MNHAWTFLRAQYEGICLKRELWTSVNDGEVGTISYPEAKLRMDDPKRKGTKRKSYMAVVALTHAHAHAHTQSPLKKTKAWHHLSFYMPSITDPFLSLKGVKKKKKNFCFSQAVHIEDYIFNFYFELVQISFIQRLNTIKIFFSYIASLAN